MKKLGLGVLGLGEGRSKPDATEGVVTIALLEAMEESCARGVPVKLKEVLVRYGLDGLLKVGNP